MAASITFDFVSRGGPALARDFKSAGDNAAAAARGAKVLSSTIETLGQKENRTAQESVLLAKALRLTGDAEDRAAAKALAADIAIRRLGDAMQDTSKSTDSARGGFAGLVGEITGFGAASTAASSKSSMFAKALAGINLASGVLEPALAGAVVAAGGVAAAFTAAAAGAAAYQLALKPLLAQTTDVMKAQETLDKARATAQAAYTAAIASGASAKTADAARTKAMTAAQDKYNIAVKGTPGPVRQFAASVTAAKNTYTGWADSLAKPVLAPLSGMLKLVKPALTAITPLVRVAAGAFGTLVTELSAKVSAGGLTSIVSTLLPHVRTTILDLGHAAGNVAAGIWGILKAFLPVSGQITGGVVKLTAKFKEWGQSLSGGTGFQSLMQTFREETPQAIAILTNLGVVLGNVGKAVFGLSTFSNSKMLLNLLTPISGILATLSKNTDLVRISLYLYAAATAAGKLRPAMVALFGEGGQGGIIRGAIKAVTWIGNMTKAMLGLDAAMNANVVGLIVIAIAALAAAFVIAWKKSAGFRDVMKTIAQGFLGAGIIIVKINKAIVDSFLSMVGTVLHAAATAFGWVPGLGSKLRGASKAFDGFKAGVDKTFDGVIGKMRQWQDSLDKTRSTSHDAAVKMTADFTRQGAAAKQAATDLGKYTAAIEKNHVNSDAAKAARASLIADLRKAGVNSSTARTDVAAYTEAVRVNGTKSEQARQARIRLNSDIATAFRNSQQGKRDISNLSEAIRQHGAKSDAARGARSRLLQDLISTGLDSRTAKTLVNNLQTAISNLKGKTVQIRMDGKGVYIISQGSGSAPIIAGKAAGGFITGGIPGRDSVLIRAMPGEVVVPTRMVKAGAVDHLRGQLPGFASGGQVSGPLTAPFVSGMYSSFQNQMAGSMVGAMRTSLKTAEAAAIAAAKAAAGVSGAGPVGGDAGVNRALARKMFPWDASQWPAFNTLEMHEAGYNRFARNASSGAYGIPQALPPTKMPFAAQAAGGSHAGPQLSWMFSYIRDRYGTPANAWAKYYAHPGGVGWYAKGGLVPGYTSGGTVAAQGQAYLNAWRSRRGGHYALAVGPRPLNQQIPAMAAAYGRARTLAGAGGLSPGQHRFWANTAAGEGKLLATLRKELATERSWRYYLQLDELSLDREIRTAGNLPGLAGPVRGWKAQLAARRHTVGEISAMIGLPAAQPAAKPGTKGGPPVSPVRVTHTYGGDVANTIGAVLSAALGPFTGAARGGMVMDSGGWLKPGWNPPSFNGTGRPEHLVPARGGGGGVHLHLTVNGPVGSQQQLEDWYVRTANKLAAHGRLTQAVRAAGR